LSIRTKTLERVGGEREGDGKRERERERERGRSVLLDRVPFLEPNF
jgi:hypothetical protein